MKVALKSSLILLILSLSTTVFAQKTVNTYYFNANGDTVLTKAEADSWKIVQTNGKNRIATEYDSSGVMRSETYFRKDLSPSPPLGDSTWWTFGRFREWYPSGQLKVEGTHVVNHLHDTLKTYYLSGILRRKDVYFKDTLLLGECFAENSSKITYFPYKEQPEFRGGLQGMFQYLSENIKYPPVAQSKEIEGTVYVGFVVSKTGNIEKIKVRRGVHTLLDAEAVRVVKAMPKWKAGKLDGELVRVAYTLPVRFQLE